MKAKAKQASKAHITNYKISRLKTIPYSLKGLIDPDYYASQSGKPFGTSLAALKHYQEVGSARGLSPLRLFDPQYYLTQIDSPLKDTTPLEHYWQEGGFAGLSPSSYFDSAYYLKKYPWTSKFNPLGHYLSHGVKELHNPLALFDSDFYVTGAMQSACLKLTPIEHYMTIGWKQGNNPHPLIDLKFIASQIAPGIALKDIEQDPLITYLQKSNDLQISPHELLDYQFYLAASDNSDLKTYREKVPSEYGNLLEYFMASDTPVVNPSVRFSALQYKSEFPDIGTMNPLYHYVRYGQNEGRQIYYSMNSVMNRDLSRQLQNEPTLLPPNQNLGETIIAPMPRKHEPGLDLMTALLEACAGFRPDVVFCLPQFSRGVAEEYGAKLTHTIARESRDKNILVIATDGDNKDSHAWYPESANVKYIVFADKNSLEVCANILVRFITLMQPRVLINNNSHACWEAYAQFGAPMGAHTKLYACLYCHDYDLNNMPVGFARDYIRNTVEHVDVFLVNNKSFSKSLQEDFSLHPSYARKFQVLYQPIEMGQSDATIRKNWPDLEKTMQEPVILWPSRFHRQKRPNLLREIALALPDVKFVVWSPTPWDKVLAGGNMPANIVNTSEESTFGEMAKRDVSGMLLCSAWEGLPTTLIESVLAGLPVIANDVGGVRELISPRTGYVVDKDASVEAYVEAISELLSAFGVATVKRQAAFEHVKSQHSSQAYLEKLKRLGVIAKMKAGPRR